MDRHATTAITSLNFLLSLFPDDDKNHLNTKTDLKQAVRRCEELLKEAEQEQTYTMKNSVQTEISQEDLPRVLGKTKPDPCPCKSKECEEDYENDLSEYRKAQLLQEAENARDSLRSVLKEVERHLEALKPGDKVDIVGGNVVITPASPKPEGNCLTSF